MAYDDGNHAIQTINPGHLTGAASASMQKFHMWRSTILKRVTAMVVTAGTNASAAVDVYVGTTSVASLVFGTSTAGSVIDSGAIDVDIPAQGYIELKGIANSATLVGAFQIQHQLDPQG